MKNKRFFPALLVFAAGAALFAFGIFRGEQEIVLTKAIRVCMECIGLG